MHCAILIKHGADFTICHEMYFFVMLVAFASRASAVLKNNMNCINYKHSSKLIITNTVYLVRSSNDMYA